MVAGKKGPETLLTHELAVSFEQLVSLGGRPAQVARQLGIGPRTYRRWVQWGRSGSKGEPYTSFVAALTRAKATAINEAVQLVKAHAVTDWRAAAWFAERAAPEEWGNRLDVTFTPRKVQALAKVSGIAPGEIEALLAQFGLAIATHEDDDLL